MKIFAHCHTYGLNAQSGADKMMQSILEYFALKGLDCVVGVDDCPNEYILNGVSVVSNRQMIAERYEAADLIIIHMVFRHEATLIAERFGKPILHICHNSNITSITSGKVVYNSYYLQSITRLQLDSIVVNPPSKLLPFADHFNQPYITLVNLCTNKGGDMFYNIARALPQYNFLGVHGGYGHQESRALPNIMYRPYGEMDYSDTKILLVPSKNESWSLCAAEAMSAGIPVICSSLPGLKENCQFAATYADDLPGYIDSIIMLHYEDIYIEKAKQGRDIAESRNNTEQLENLYNFVTEQEKKVIIPVKEKRIVQPGKKKNYGTN